MSICDVAGVRVGHWTDPMARTGCTVVLLPAPHGAVAGVDVRGSAPGTRETDLLRPGMLVERVHAICLSGGSAFGLAAADGVMRYLRERGTGLPVGPAVVPIVPAAVVFDLGVGEPAWPGPDQGYAACEDAERAAGRVVEGRVGAGTGSTVGKLLGPERSSPGGVGTASVRLPGGATVGVVAVANALGDVVGRDGRIVSGARDAGGGWADVRRVLLEQGRVAPPPAGSSTTIAVVATDAALDKARCRKLAEQAQDGLALAVRPAHTMLDGDTVFAVSAGDREADLTSLGLAASEAMWTAMQRAVAGG